MSAIKKPTRSVFDQELGFRLKTLRQTHNMSQEHLGEVLSTSYQQVQRYESGANRLSPEKIQLCAKILHVPISYFFDHSTHDDIYKFDKKVLNIANAIASLPDPNLAKQVYQLVLSMNENLETSNK